MQNRKNLHDYGLVLMILGITNLFMFVTTIVAGLVDGTFAKEFATVNAEFLVAAKVMVGVIGGIMGLIVFGDTLIGMKALKISKNPNADKGYITAAKIFFILSGISAISAFLSLLNGSAPIVDTILNLVNAVLGAIIYVLFIKAAQAVRQDVLNGKK